ncbi:MAG: hypothetical protein WA864_13990 [Acetobacteraceae bacterium]|jgi:hypothetical protein
MLATRPAIAMRSPFDQLDTMFRSHKHGPMASVYQVEALVRQRPGISLDELREALGTDIHRPLKRLVVLGYIKRVVSIDQPISRSVIGLLGTGRRRRAPPRAVVFFPLERPGSPDSERRGKAK